MTDYPDEVVERVKLGIINAVKHTSPNSKDELKALASYLLSIVGPLVEALKKIESAVHEKALSKGITHDTSCEKAYELVQAALASPTLKELGITGKT